MKNRDKIHWGVLGCANIAIARVIPAIQESLNAQVLALGSRDLEKARKTAQTLNIPRAYGSYEEVLADPDIQAVYIPLPNNLHAEWTLQAAARGKHVLCEKPVAMTPEECERMIEACQTHRVLFMEGFMYRLHPQNQHVKDLVTSGVIGTVKLVRAAFSFPITPQHPAIRLSKELGGGALMDIGCYGINVCRWIFEAEPTAVFARAEIDPDRQVDTSLVAVLEFPEGRKGLLDCSFTMARRHTYEVVGTEGKIEVPAAFVPTGETSIYITNQEGTRQEERFEAVNQYRLEFDHFSDCILKNKPLSFSPGDALGNMKVIAALRQSQQEERPIFLA
ncbi:MAG: Gfo/Idh/MocA family oxidoreductase [Nitrospira sp.]|nr:Gfo/Idh/MocA family oxidoreductase [Nitrospira sp.]